MQSEVVHRAVPTCKGCKKIQKTCSHKVLAGIHKMMEWAEENGVKLSEEKAGLLSEVRFRFFLCDRFIPFF